MKYLAGLLLLLCLLPALALFIDVIFFQYRGYP